MRTTRREVLGLFGAAVAFAGLPRRSNWASAPPAPPSPNPFLDGNFGPIHDEHTELGLRVAGTVPGALLGGTLLRIGPNPIVVPDPANYHWFLGDGMVHGFTFRDDGLVDARNRWVRTDSAAAALGEGPLRGQPKDVLPINPANTSIVHFADRILALLEVALPTEIDIGCGTVGRFDFDGQLTSAMTAHPKLDPVTGELIFFGMSLGGPPNLRYHSAAPDGTLTTRVVDVPQATMMHDFAVTATNAVFFDCPVVYGAPGAGNFPARWLPSAGMRVGVVSRSGGEPTWIEVDPCFTSHVVNAYDDGRSVVVDVLTYPSIFDDSMPYGPAGAVGTLERWTIDAANGTVVWETVDDRPQEYPRTDPRVACHPHRFGYTVEAPNTDAAPNFGTILKQDFSSGRRTAAVLPDGAAASEAIFVPESATSGEDEGWLVATVYRPGTDTSEVVLIDAQSMGRPVATIALPYRVPFGFHGAWVPAT